MAITTTANVTHSRERISLKRVKAAIAIITAGLVLELQFRQYKQAGSDDKLALLLVGGIGGTGISTDGKWLGWSC